MKPRQNFCRFYYLPKFALAAIVMNSVIPLVAFGEARHLFHVKKHDFVLWVLTLGHID